MNLKSNYDNCRKVWTLLSHRLFKLLLYISLISVMYMLHAQQTVVVLLKFNTIRLLVLFKNELTQLDINKPYYQAVIFSTPQMFLIKIVWVW